MASGKKRARIPKIEGFERIKYQHLTLSGLTARAYSAYFGTPRRIIDAYSILYCRGQEKSVNTGRISNATTLLVNANYLDMFKVERSNWPLLCANLQPLYELFYQKGVKLDAEDRRRLFDALLGTPKAAERFGITDEEALGKAEFIPSPLKMQSYLNSASTFGLLSLYKQQQPQFKEEREMLRRIKQKAYGASSEEKEERANPAILENFSADLALNAKASLKTGDEPSEILLFKIIRLNHEKPIALKIEEEAASLFR